MNAEIICVGSELLLGDILNTNAQFIARQLAILGISVYNQQVVGDNQERLKQAVEIAKSRSDIIILSGGLGPTDDDITKQTVAKMFNDTLVFNEEISNGIKDYFKKNNRAMTENNLKQAYVPKKGKWFENKNGTAPGVVFLDNNKLAILLPGPPKELSAMFESKVMPMLSKLINGIILSRYINIIGIGESALEEKIAQLTYSQNPTIALYAKEGEVTVRITAQANNTQQAQKLLDDAQQKLVSLIPEYVYGIDEPNLESVIVKCLAEKNMTVATAESCTGGNISARLTSVSGASNVFSLGVCAYSAKQKIQILGVNEEDIDLYTPVSSIVANQMANNVRKMANSDYGIATTGYAGPNGGTIEEPVGTVYIALSAHDKTYVRKCHFEGDREKITHLATQNALDMLRCLVNDIKLVNVQVFDNDNSEITLDFHSNNDIETEPKTNKIIKTVGAIIAMVALGVILGFGWIWYQNDFIMPTFDFSSISVFNIFKKDVSDDVPTVVLSRQDEDFFSKGFESDTLKMLNSLSSQNHNVKGWLTFKGIQKELAVTTHTYAQETDFCVYEKDMPFFENYTFLEGFTTDDVKDLTVLENVKQNNKFTLFTDDEYKDYQVFSVATFDEEEYANLFNTQTSEEFIVQSRAYSLFEVDVQVKKDDSLLMLAIEDNSGEHIVVYAKEFAKDIFPSVDRKEFIMYADWYKQKTGVNDELSQYALEEAQEMFDRDNFDWGTISPQISPSPEGEDGQVSPSGSPSPSPSGSPSPSPSGSPSPSPNGSPSPSPNGSPSPSPSKSPSASPTPTPTPTPTPSGNMLTVTMNGVVTTDTVTNILSQIVALEMTYTWNPEALKAQAIAAHTYIKYQHSQGNSAPSVSGRSDPNQAVVNAVSQVSNIIMTIGGKAVYTPYCASVAGRTNSSADVWGGAYSHLQSVESKYDYQSSGYEKSYTFTVDQIRAVIDQKIGANLSENPAEWFEILSYTDGGYVKNMRVGDKTTYTTSSGGQATITGRAMRENILSETGTTIRSAAFDIAYADGNFTFTTRGYGHGAGMSQWGAQLYAQNEGWSYSQILTHYYTGVTLSAI